LTASPESFGRRPKRGSGSSELRLQTTIKIGRFPKVSLVTPNTRVRPAPIRPPVTLPALEMDIRVANKVASIPGGHNFAASTKTGINEAYKKTEHIRLCKITVIEIKGNISKHKSWPHIDRNSG
jgi:hypothetical protein